MGRKYATLFSLWNAKKDRKGLNKIKEMDVEAGNKRRGEKAGTKEAITSCTSMKETREEEEKKGEEGGRRKKEERRNKKVTENL